MTKILNILVILLVIASSLLLLYFYLNDSQLDLEEEVSLSSDEARQLVIDNWGDCDIDTCSELLVSLNKESDPWEIIAIYDGLYDDSVQAMRKIIPVYLEDEQWILGSASITHRCQVGRGHQDFSAEYCF